MSWNPRRFAEEARTDTTYDDATALIWVTREAVERLESAHESDVVHPTPLPFDTSLMLGLAAPVPMPNGEIARVVIRSAKAHLDEVRPKLLAGGAEGAALLKDQRLKLEDGLRTVVGLSEHSRMVAYRTLNANTLEMTGAETADEYREVAPTIAQNWLGDDDAKRLTALLRAVWTVYTSPVEADVTATETGLTTVTVGSKRRARDIPVQVVDIRRPRGESASGDSHRDPLDHQYRWEVRGHWRMQWYGSGDDKVQRRIWIDQQVRGPEDKPIKTRVEVVNADDIDRIPPPQPATEPEPVEES